MQPREMEKGNNLTLASDEESLEKSSPGRRVGLLSDSNENKSSRNLVCASDEERACSLESRSGLTSVRPGA